MSSIISLHMYTITTLFRVIFYFMRMSQTHRIWFGQFPLSLSPLLPLPNSCVRFFIKLSPLTCAWLYNFSRFTSLEKTLTISAVMTTRPMQELETFVHRFQNFSLPEFVILWNYLVVFLYSDICVVYFQYLRHINNARIYVWSYQQVFACVCICFFFAKCHEFSSININKIYNE